MSAVASDRLMASARVLATYSASSMPEITRFPFPGESTGISMPIGAENVGLKPLLTHASARALDPRPRTAALGAGRSGLFGQGCSLCAGVGCAGTIRSLKQRTTALGFVWAGGGH
jgi:hypothetical protein